MHGIGVHPNWDQVIRPIRVEMTTRGWNTLSIQMPVLANDAATEDYAKLFPEVTPELMLRYSSRKSRARITFVNKNDELVDAVDDWLMTLS